MSAAPPLPVRTRAPEVPGALHEQAPFFDSGPLPGERGRLLLVSYYFPPSPATGALRWQKLARVVAERGLGLDVVTLAPAGIPRPDPRRLEDLPEGVRIYGVPHEPHPVERIERVAWQRLKALRAALRPAPKGARETGAGPSEFPQVIAARPESFSRAEVQALHASPRDAVRAYHAWLEYARDGQWAAAAAVVGRRLAATGTHRAVISCGPPHMAHEAGRRIAQGAGLPLVTDFRDPWSLVQRLPEPIASRFWFGLAERHERRVLEASSLIVTNTEPARRGFQARYPSLADRVVTVMNGYDDDVVPVVSRRERFVVAYAGTIYLDRDPRPLLRAAGRLVRDLGLDPARFGLEFMGYVEGFGGQSLEALAADAGLAGYLRTHTPRPRAEALAFLADASLLVSLPQDSDMAIPAKVFEYMLFDAWMLALATPASATGQLLHGSGADVVEPQDEEGIHRVLRQRYTEFRAGIRPARLASDDRFSRRRQGEILLDHLERLTLVQR